MEILCIYVAEVAFTTEESRSSSAEMSGKSEESEINAVCAYGGDLEGHGRVCVCILVLGD